MGAVELSSTFYHIKNLQSTKTNLINHRIIATFYHIKNLQSTKTRYIDFVTEQKFYHIKNLQSTKTRAATNWGIGRFITLRIYKVLKHSKLILLFLNVLSH